MPIRKHRKLSDTKGGRRIMNLYQVIVVDENDNLYDLQDTWINENFEYDKDYSTITPIKNEEE